MKRILYYSGHQIIMSQWKNKVCVASCTFNVDKISLKQFKSYLQSTENTPISILIDVAEEDHKQEIIPHVSTADRRTIVSRIIMRQYKASLEFVHYRLIGRKKEGRKDDILLCSILNKPKILDPILKILSECKTPVSGIWSLPQLSTLILSKLNITANNVLLISQQTPDNLRLTFFKKKIFQSSRLSNININVNSDIISLEKTIFTKTEQTIRFLLNQHIIDSNESIEIHIICCKENIQKTQSYCLNSELYNFHYHDINNLERHIGCHSLEKTHIVQQSLNHCQRIYSYLCARQLFSVGHYGSSKLFSDYYKLLTSRFLNTISIIIILMGVLFSFDFLSKSYSLNQKSKIILSQEDSFRSLYKKSFSSLSKKIASAQAMKSSVLLSNKIRDYKILSPQKFMTDISLILSPIDMNDITITRLIWKLHQGMIITDSNEKKSKQLISYANPTPIYQRAIIEGHVNLSKKNLNRSINKINSIINTLRDNPKVLKINIIRMPFDTRSQSSIENIPDNHNSTGTNIPIGIFEIELLMASKTS